MPDLFSYRPYWAQRMLPAPLLPMSRAEMDQLGWDSCDVILVTGDAYVDHPSFGMAIVGRLLESQGFRVGIIAQPDWRSVTAFQQLGRPNLYFGVTAGNMDSMVNHYTSDRRRRSDDAYSPGGEGGKRPDRAVVHYSQRIREAYKGATVVIGGIEASLRRLAHYDYWSDTVKRSVLVDSKADILLYGNAERALVALTHRLAQGEHVNEIRDLRGTVYLLNQLPAETVVVDRTVMPAHGEGAGHIPKGEVVIRLPDYEALKGDAPLYAYASRLFHHETNPANARALVQRHGARELWVNPPPIPLTTKELDRVFDQPFTRRPHPSYGEAIIPAYEMIRFSVNIMRGCFGGCSFCSITEHEGRIVQNRSEASILREVEAIRDRTPGFTGNISDLGGPTANMYRLRCKDPRIESNCRRLSCVFPEICPHMGTDHQPLIELYRKTRSLPGIKRVFIASGLRYDLALRSPQYIKELVTHHVGGYLKIAPEHTESQPLALMMKPGIAVYERFKLLFEQFSQQAGKEQYLIPYFISAHPGSSELDMVNLALWLKRHSFRLDQVQNFLPSPMALATAIYHSGLNPMHKVEQGSEVVVIPKGDRQRRIQKALLRYHDAANWPLLREVLEALGRADLIGNGKRHLVPSWQPRDEPGAPSGHGGRESRGITSTAPAQGRPAASKRIAPSKRPTKPSTSPRTNSTQRPTRNKRPKR